MSLKIVQHNKETIETCQEKSNGIFKGMPHTKEAQQTKPLCISKKGNCIQSMLYGRIRFILTTPDRLLQWHKFRI